MCLFWLAIILFLQFQLMMEEVKQLQEKLALLEKEHQEYLSLKDINQLLQTKVHNEQKWSP